nr:cyclodeaminase/cyclohydrolase family protein [uncultured Mucilaginibacter sp.]
MEKLIELSTEKLLEKFGSGNHKPGSGSAAAFQGMLSAQLIRTVADLTLKRQGYKPHHPELINMISELETRIYPALVHYFQLDSEQFDRVIELRRELKAEGNLLKSREIKQSLDDAMRPATQTPIAIAYLCADLAGFALFVCDHGFQAARGDSGVAVNNLIATIAGCLSIVNLNLLSLGNDEETEQIRLDASKLKAKYLELSSKAIERLTRLEDEARRHQAFHQELNSLASGKWAGKQLSNTDIEQLARHLQNTLYQYSDKINKQPRPENLLELLRPEIVITKILNYRYEETETLGRHFVDGEFYEVAGVIDNPKRLVSISQQFSKETRNFTAAHELGHALLHRQAVLHRDKAIDGSGAVTQRSLTELQADKFATYFLMPSKIVTEMFKELFQTNKFVINENTVFSLTVGSVGDFKKRCRSLRELSRILAEAEFYREKPFRSMAEMFNVSVETMAIRLEELGLAEF